MTQTTIQNVTTTEEIREIEDNHVEQRYQYAACLRLGDRIQANYHLNQMKLLREAHCRATH